MSQSSMPQHRGIFIHNTSFCTSVNMHSVISGIVLQIDREKTIRQGTISNKIRFIKQTESLIKTKRNNPKAQLLKLKSNS